MSFYFATTHGNLSPVHRRCIRRWSRRSRCQLILRPWPGSSKRRASACGRSILALLVMTEGAENPPRPALLCLLQINFSCRCWPTENTLYDGGWDTSEVEEDNAARSRSSPDDEAKRWKRSRLTSGKPAGSHARISSQAAHSLSPSCFPRLPGNCWTNYSNREIYDDTARPSAGQSPIPRS